MVPPAGGCLAWPSTVRDDDPADHDHEGRSVQTSNTNQRSARFVVAAVLLALTMLAAGSPATAQSQDPSSTTIRIEGGGWGHGVGMSQYGAYGRALAGQSHQQILGFYYPGTQLATRDVGDAGVRVHLSTARSIRVETTGVVRLRDADGSVVWTSARATTLIVDRLTNGRLRVRTPSGVNRCRVDGVNVCRARPVTIDFNQGEPVRTVPSGVADPFGTSGNRYQWGRLVFTPRPGTDDTLWQVLEGLSMQQYLYGIAEVPSSWPEAALESQAIAARTFAASNIAARRADPNRTVPWDLFSSVYDQFYSGYGHEVAAMSERWSDAVDRTADRVLTYNGQPFAAFYSSSNGGHSEESGYVFVTSLPYLVAQPDAFDGEGNPFATWVREYSGSDVGRWIAAAGRGSIGEAVSLSISGNVGASGRVERATITVRGTTGTATMTGSQFRSAVNNGVIAAGGGLDSQLLSTKFDVAAVGASGNLSAPIGELEDTRRRNGKAIVGGWVADPDVVAAGANAAVAPVEVRITVGRRTVATTTASQYRFDMDQVHGHRTTRGFRVAVDIPDRRRRICAYASSDDGGPEVLLGCRRI